MSAAACAALLVTIPWRWLPSFEVADVAREAKPPAHEERRLPERTPIAPPAPAPDRMAIVPEEVVLRAIERSRSAFHACWTRALRVDPTLDATKITLHVELDVVGTVVAVTHDATNEKLGACLVMVARGMQFTAPMSNAVAEFPVFFQPE